MKEEWKKNLLGRRRRTKLKRVEFLQDSIKLMQRHCCLRFKKIGKKNSSIKLWKKRTTEAGKKRTTEAGKKRTTEAGKKRTTEAGKKRTTEAGKKRNCWKKQKKHVRKIKSKPEYRGTRKTKRKVKILKRVPLQYLYFFQSWELHSGKCRIVWKIKLY